MAAVAAGGAAAGDELLAPESHAAVAAVTGFQADFYFVDEHKICRKIEKAARPGAGRVSHAGRLGEDSRFNADEFAHAAAIAELDHAGDFGEQGVVLAPADVLAGLEARTSLPHNDRSAGDELSAEDLDSEPLRVGIAAVFRTA